MRVRTTFRPDLVIEVDDAEYLDLYRQGLIVEDTPALEATEPVVPVTPPNKPEKPALTPSGKEE